MFNLFRKPQYLVQWKSAFNVWLPGVPEFNEESTYKEFIKTLRTYGFSWFLCHSSKQATKKILTRIGKMQYSDSWRVISLDGKKTIVVKITRHFPELDDELSEH